MTLLSFRDFLRPLGCFLPELSKHLMLDGMFVSLPLSMLPQRALLQDGGLISASSCTTLAPPCI